MVSEVLWLLPGTSLFRRSAANGRWMGCAAKGRFRSGAGSISAERENSIGHTLNAAKHKSAVDIPMVAV
jgi:hypothetical protein